MALAAKLNYTIWKVDVRDAYAHPPGPKTPTFIRICDQFADWYQACKGHAVNQLHIIPLLHALQGHPEAGSEGGLLVSPVSGDDLMDGSSLAALLVGVSTALIKEGDSWHNGCDLFDHGK
jgi:hypothetical protein